MRRRSLLLALPLGALTLSACDADTPDPPELEPTTRPDLAVDPAPTLIGESAEVVDPTTLRLPLEMTVMIVVDPGWTATPQVMDGIFLGYDSSGDRLGYTAVDQDGTALWSAQRPLSCTDFALSRDTGGRAVAVLTDTTPPGAASDGTTDGAIGGTASDGGGSTDAPPIEGDAERTATGYDLRTADTLWGPVSVPGPRAAPGLVYAATATAADAGSRIVLSADTGEVLLAEEDLDDGRILAEHAGVVLRTAGTDVVAGLWRVPLPDGVDPSAARIAGAIDESTGQAVLVGEEGVGALLDIADGSVLAAGVAAAAYDHGLDVTVVAAGSTVRGLDEHGEETWRHEDPEQLVFLSAGERLAYAQRPEEGTLVVLDTSQGLMVQPYDADLTGPLAVPELFSADAATSVYIEDARYLVTTTLDEEYGLRD